ncbi:MAG: hypothetical protein H5T42_05825 [Methanothrix sp.]|jgi:hypothetical protein|uniref:Uncharacterized protein n=1 Tax=Methanothrix thermoacetophila (strain DSM 6194 / JCM 14653 / NBRC 101360 / PT) TaxID=349307 RepID=A0B579_METTP|nr:MULTISPECIES: hypothetical protein [Methanothrix]ABK13853.1 hypothetical protein Mthe_0051 [Methanothrix thermoacetophila PT]MBC7079971.1 hypothetical protein [Methanothrix sp.]NPU88120.1 hypothetical protein [Methanothrix sp.]
MRVLLVFLFLIIMVTASASDVVRIGLSPKEIAIIGLPVKNTTHISWARYGGLDEERSIHAEWLPPLSDYSHTPELYEFLLPTWTSPGFGVDTHIKPIYEFIQEGWQPPNINYTEHTPEIAEFMSESWQPSPPSEAAYTGEGTGLAAFLR